ncbi:outer membrane protein transport protein [Microbulbifer salipaludis]|uniref:Outer membrane protein transport protein n=1 Tax=Microbulbifer salipaludis TaxID=187980 RepID=A0ABS3E9S3_9GAMM|nr:outer membrane protein transport protein [Microbulbifer salipaludis]MBN8432057.1 outer membrane protein transport protein [Microbulbifer salipaludis]
MPYNRAASKVLPLLVAALSAPAAHAGGIMLWQIGTPTLGTASAGWAAMPEDASTAFTNPAGTVWRDETQVRAAAQALYGDLEFSEGGLSNVPGNDGGNPLEWLPGAGAFAAGKITDNIGWGFAMAGNFGLGLDYHDDWQGRRFVQNVDLLGMSLIPSLSWRANDCLSIGVGLNAMAGYFSFQSAPRAGLVDDDAFLRLKDLDMGYGGNLGIIYRPKSGTTFGLSYTSKVDFEFKDHLKLRNFTPPLNAIAENLDGTRTELDIRAPQTVTASLQQALTDTTTLYVNLNWQDWSEYAGVTLSLDNPMQTSLRVDRGYRDTAGFAVGIRHEFQQGMLNGWRLSTGLSAESSMANTSEITADTITNENVTVGFGAGKELCPGVNLDVGYNYMYLGDIDIDQQGRPPFSPRLQGTYEDSAIHFVGGSVQFSF